MENTRDGTVYYGNSQEGSHRGNGESQGDFGFPRLLSPQLQQAQGEKTKKLWNLLKSSARRSRALAQKLKEQEKRVLELETKNVELFLQLTDLTAAYNELK